MTVSVFLSCSLGEMMDSSCGRDAFNITSQGSGVGSGLYISGVYLSGDMMGICIMKYVTACKAACSKMALWRVSCV